MVMMKLPMGEPLYCPIRGRTSWSKAMTETVKDSPNRRKKEDAYLSGALPNELSIFG